MSDLEALASVSAELNREQELIAGLEAVGVNGASMIEVDKITFRPEFRALCEQNRCGNYNNNWRCPPKCGEIHDLIEALKKSKRAMVFSFVASLKNSYDMKGMISAGLVFGKVCQGVLARSGQLFADKKPTVLGAGPCNNCEKCAILTKEPCRYPDQAITSLEACGVDVSQLAKLSGLKYNAGAGTITYFGAVFL